MYYKVDDIEKINLVYFLFFSMARSAAIFFLFKARFGPSKTRPGPARHILGPARPGPSAIGPVTTLIDFKELNMPTEFATIESTRY